MKAKILVVDDDPAISEMLSIVLEAEGFDTVAVTDGAELSLIHISEPTRPY